MLKLTLKACSNPDYSGRPLPKASTVEVSSFAEARETFENWRDSNELGGGNMSKNCGQLHADKVLLGHFSYNARFWPSSDLRIEAIVQHGLPQPTLALGV